MHATLTVLCLPKAGNSPAENEDSAFPNVSGRFAGPSLRCAVADGASETLLSGPWAAVLARSYARVGPGEAGASAVVQRAQRCWARWRHAYLRRRARVGRPIQWFEEPGLAAGAYASLVGLTLDGGDTAGAWSALAVGDSCLFQVRSDGLICAFPLARAADFGVRPWLIGSREHGAGAVLDAARATGGDWQVGDRFYLVTDALAQWWLAECEADRRPWRAIDRLCGPGRARTFPQWLTTRRRRRQLRNDDVTLLRVALRAEHRPCPGPS